MYKLFTSLLALLFLYLVACSTSTTAIRYKFINNCDIDVEFIAPIKPMSWNHHQMCGDMHDIAINDTTLLQAKQLFFRAIMRSNSSHSVCNNYSSIEEMSPYDTVRIFVRPLDANGYPMVDSDEYLCRYDLSLKDLSLLLNSDNEIVICYPPDETMRRFKMWPTYGFYNDN